MATREIDLVVDQMRHATEALARPRRPVPRGSIAPADHGQHHRSGRSAGNDPTESAFWHVVVVLLLVVALPCAFVVGADQRDTEQRPALVSDTSHVVRVDGKRPTGGRLFLTAVRRLRPPAEVATTRVVAMETSGRNAIRAALDCVEPSSRHNVSIDPGRLTGGSAGLMFALTIVDALEPFEFDGHVAGTGMISTTGVVGPIGEIAMKARAARHAGADLFLAPKAQAAAAERAASDLRVVGVDTLDEAVRSLGRTHGCSQLKGEKR